MPEFLTLIAPDEAFTRWKDSLPAGRRLPTERVRAAEAAGRVAAADVHSPEALPAFSRASVDGYAVRAADTFGASPSQACNVRLAGEVPMGSPPTVAIRPGEAALIHTGGMLPDGADAVVMLEDTQTAPADEIEILRPVSVGANVIRAGEDLQEGETALRCGSVLRPQEIGGLMALGIREIDVVRPPRVALISTGDELLPPDASLARGKIRDVNSAMLGALMRACGGLPVPLGIVTDSRGALTDVLRRALPDHDLVIVTAGSSASARDTTADAFAALGEPGIVVHGLAIRPGKPTLLAAAGGVPLIGLPGNPVSALTVAHLLVAPMIRHLLGLDPMPPAAALRARLLAPIPSEAGRTDFQPVRVAAGEGGLEAEPVFGKSNLIFTLVRAGGIVRIPPEATGLDAGTMVDVIPFESWIGTGTDR
jgi:molybdopterin molybdotransferase